MKPTCATDSMPTSANRSPGGNSSTFSQAFSIFRESILLVTIGIALGLGLALVATRPLSMFLTPEISPTDPVAFLNVTVMLLVVAFAAAIGPALRALRV